MQATGSGKLEVAGHEISGQAILSTTGVGVCGTIDLFGAHSIGFGLRWADFPQPQIELSGCDLSAWSATASSAAATVSRQIEVGAHLPFFAIKVSGVGGDAPSLLARGPGGAVIAPPAGASFVNRTSYFYLRDVRDDMTYLIVSRPKPGVWTVESSDGTTPIGSVAVAHGLEPAAPRAWVISAGRARILRYQLRRQPGQQVAFYDTSDLGSALIGRTAIASGRIRFVPIAGSDRVHTIAAVVIQGGLPAHPSHRSRGSPRVRCDLPAESGASRSSATGKRA